jgi:ADP-ribosyl-[dinitrogen reductase] hydrolase
MNKPWTRTRVPRWDGVTGERRESAIVGCLLGGAVGDALGAPIEGYVRSDIDEYYGEVRGHLERPRFPVVGMPTPWRGSGLRRCYTDDTILALALADSLIDEGRLDLGAFTAHQLALWKPDEDLWLIRGAGHTEINFVKGVAAGFPVGKAATPSEGCGAAMRVGPLGVFYAHDLRKLVRAATRQAELTHASDYARASSAAIALGCALALRGMEPGAGFLEVIARKTRPLCDAFACEAERLARAVVRGDGWPWGLPEYSVGPHVAPVALVTYAVHGGDFARCVIEAATFGGDNDSAAAMAGAMAGAYGGVEAIPEELADIRFRDQVEARGYALAGDVEAAERRVPLETLERELIGEGEARRAELREDAEPKWEAWIDAVIPADVTLSRKARKRFGMNLRMFSKNGIGPESREWFLRETDVDLRLLPLAFEAATRKIGGPPSKLRQFLNLCAVWVAEHAGDFPRVGPWHEVGELLLERDLDPADDGVAFWHHEVCLVPQGIMVKAGKARIRYRVVPVVGAERSSQVEVPLGGDVIPGPASLAGSRLRRVRVDEESDEWSWTHRIGHGAGALEVQHLIRFEESGWHIKPVAVRAMCAEES